MRATGDSILLHPVGTFSYVTGSRRRIREKMFADMFNGDKAAHAACEPESEQVLVVRCRDGTLRGATPSRSRVRRVILASIFNRKSSGGKGGGRPSDLVVLRLPKCSFSDSLPQSTG